MASLAGHAPQINQRRESADFLVLGGGLAGLAAGIELEDRCIVLERHDRPGGLVRSLEIEGYHFDHVLHSLYFSDPGTAERVLALTDGLLQKSHVRAYVETLAGTTQFPFQMHLNGLPPDEVAQCIHDLAKTTFGDRPSTARNFEEMLRFTFGERMCELFLLPYNHKVWKRPLDQLAPSGFQWTITPPNFQRVLLGALQPTPFDAYNSDSWYPLPDRSPRGMEALSHALAAHVSDLRLNHRVVQINLKAQTVTVESDGDLQTMSFNQGCCSTLPLPVFVELCVDPSSRIRELARSLKWNRVLTIALAVKGERPSGTGHWRYYADPQVPFTRLVYMHEFDPATAPPEGWGLLAEITQPAEEGLPDRDQIVRDTVAGCRRVGALRDGDSLVGAEVLPVEFGYVVFEPETRAVADEIIRELEQYGVTMVGRYATWDYLSMSQVMRDGFAVAARLKQVH